MYFLFEAIADLFLNLFLAGFYSSLYPLVVLSFLIGITYSKKESIYSVSLILICFLVPVYVIF
ncbi:unnamed protein product, partial [marine sediment metagenome]